MESETVVNLIKNVGYSTSIIGLAVLFLYSVYKGYKSKAIEVQTKYKGVKGWLYLLCLYLMFIGPLLNTYLLASTYKILSDYYESRLNKIPMAVSIDIILSILLIIFSCYAGIVLFTIRPKAVRIVKIFWVTYAFYTILSGFISISNIMGSSEKLKAVEDVFKGLIPAVIWYSYLVNSKRVKETYGT